MPIIEVGIPVEMPLSQGDILKGMRLCFTKWNPDGGEFRDGKQSLCLVLSRPCVTAHKDRIVVAAIEKYKNSPPSQLFDSFDKAQQFYVEIRDGLTTPDQFYLGQIPNHDGCFCARFDLLHNIQIPSENSPERLEFIRTTRIARLNQEFIHDLHLRHARAFASLGFDDHKWFSTSDLRALVTIGERDLTGKNKELLDIQSKLTVGQSQGFQHESGKSKLEKEEEKLKKEIEELNKMIQPYKDELNGRDAR